MKASKAGGVEEGTSSDDSEEGTGAVASEDAFAASGSAAPLGPSDQGRWTAAGNFLLCLVKYF